MGNGSKIQITRKQHYVWRHYLKSWSKNEQIFSLLKDQKKIIQANLMNIGQERDFYKLERLSELEYKYSRALLQKDVPDALAKANIFFLDIFHNIEERLENRYSKKLFKDKDEAFKALRIQSMESMQSIIEKTGIEIIDKLKSEDIHILNDLTSKQSLCHFIMAQYLRTKKMKETLKDRLRDNAKGLNFGKMWPYLLYGFANTMGLSLSQRISLTYLKSEKNEFITSDQPAFNLNFNDLDENGGVKTLEIFYPITPILAIKISADERFAVDSKEIDDSDVEYYNNFIYENALNQVYTSTEKQLLTYQTV